MTPDTIEKSAIYNAHLEGGSFYWPPAGNTPSSSVEGTPTVTRRLFGEPPPAVLLIHGLTATTAEVRLLGQRLHQAGCAVAGPLLPGHGTHPDDLNRVRWQDWDCVVEDAYQALRQENPDAAAQRLFVGGESTGALLALLLASRHPEIAGLLIYAPALRLTLRADQALLLRLMAPFVPALPKPNFPSNPEMPWQGYAVNPLKGTLQLLRLQQVVTRLLPQIRQPILIMQGRKDLTVHPTVPEFIYDHVASPLKEIYWMEDSTHCVILDRELDQVTQLTLAFMQKVIGGTPRT